MTFHHCTSLTQIYIPSSVKSIKDLAFCECTSLSHVSIPSSLTLIGDDAFSCCSSLTQITVYNSFDSNGEEHSSNNPINRNAFLNCSKLKLISIPSSINIVEFCAFANCSSLVQMIIPSSVTLIGDLAFDGCSSLQEITIPSNAKIGKGVFRRCLNLEKITIQRIPRENPILKYYKNKFLLCKSDSCDENYDTLLWIKPKFRILTLPSFIKIIEEHAFSDYSLLEHIQISPSLNSINSFAFRGCSSLKKNCNSFFCDINWKLCFFGMLNIERSFNSFFY